MPFRCRDISLPSPSSENAVALSRKSVTVGSMENEKNLGFVGASQMNLPLTPGTLVACRWKNDVDDVALGVHLIVVE